MRKLTHNEQIRDAKRVRARTDFAHIRQWAEKGENTKGNSFQRIRYFVANIRQECIRIDETLNMSDAEIEELCHW